MMAGVERINDTLNQFKMMLAEPLQSKIALTPPFRFFPAEDAGACDWPKSYEEVWNIPCVHVGVYLLFNARDELQYIGVSAVVGKRLGDYFKHKNYPVDKACIIKDESKRDCHIVRAVLFADSLPKYFAPALEWFLIEKLSPPGNRNFRLRE